MATFTVEHQTQLSKQEAFKRVQNYLQNSEGLKKLDSNLEYVFDEANFKGHVKSSKFQCAMTITGEQAAAKVSLEVSLSLLLSPFKGTVRETLQKKFKQILG
jgi:hypothetical protein